MGRIEGQTRKRLESGILAVLAELSPDWVKQHAALGKIMELVDPSTDPGLQHRMEMALSGVMQLDPILNRGRLQKFAALLIQQHYTPDAIMKAYALGPDTPWAKAWQSKGGTVPPSERAMRDTLEQLGRGRSDGDGGVIDYDKA